jgi:MFS family permease
MQLGLGMPDLKQPPSGGKKGVTPLERLPQFGLLCAFFFFASFTSYAPWTHIATMVNACNSGIGGGAIALSFTLTAIGSLAGRFLWGMACDRFGATSTLCANSACLVLLMLAWPALASTSAATVALFGFLFGCGQGGMITSVATTVMAAFREYPKSYETRTLGVIYGVVSVAGAFGGPVVFGTLLERESPTTAAAFLAGCHSLALAAALALRVLAAVSSARTARKVHHSHHHQQQQQQQHAGEIYDSRKQQPSSMVLP